jgi:cytochrome c peroxidase
MRYTGPRFKQEFISLFPQAAVKDTLSLHQILKFIAQFEQNIPLITAVISR